MAKVSEACLQGVWKREWIEVNEQRSNSAEVLWAQAGDLFVDIRIPHDRPDVSGYRCLQELPDALLAQLKTAEGFAGTVGLRDSVCTWHREINWRGPPEETDAGALHFEHTGALIETGVHANYSESWRQHISPPIEAHRFGIPDLNDNLQGIVIFSENHFFFGIGLPVSKKQKSAEERTSGQRPDEIASASLERHYFNSEYAYGIWNGTEGIAVLHTNPFCQNRQLLSCGDGGTVWHRLDSAGLSKAIVLGFV